MADSKDKKVKNEEGFLDFDESNDISCLKLLYEQGNYSRFVPLKNKVVIGSSDNCDLVLIHPSIESRHIGIKRVEEGVIVHIFDKNKKSFFRNKSLESGKNYKFKAGQIIRIGDFEICFEKDFPLQLDEKVEKKLIFDGFDKEKPEHLKYANKTSKEENVEFTQTYVEEDSEEEIDDFEIQTSYRIISFLTDVVFAFLVYNVLCLYGPFRDFLLRVHFIALENFGLVTSSTILRDFFLDRTNIIPIILIFFFLNFISHLIFKVSIGQFLIGIYSRKLRNIPAQDMIRYVVGQCLAPFLVFDLPLVFGKRTFKELVTGTILQKDKRDKVFDVTSFVFIFFIWILTGYSYYNIDKSNKIVKKHKQLLKEAETTAWVSLLQGTAFFSMSSADKRNPLKKGQELKNGSFVYTDEKSRVVVTFPNRTKLNLGANSSMRLGYSSKDERSLISLLKGQLRGYAKPSGDSKNNKLIIATKYSSVGIRGTEFLLSVSATTEIVSVIGFSGETTLTPVHNPDLLDEELSSDFLDNHLQKGVQTTIRAARVAVVNPRNFTVSKGVKISPDQYRVLRDLDPLSLQINDVKNDFLDGVNRYTEPRPGGFFDFTTGYYIQPDKKAEYDNELGIFKIQEMGNVDSASGNYIPPSGLKLTNDGFETVGYMNEDDRLKVEKLNKNVFRGEKTDPYIIMKYIRNNYDVMLENYNVWKEVDGVIGINVFSYAQRVNNLSSYLLLESSLDGSPAQFKMYESIIRDKIKTEKINSLIPKDLVEVEDAFGFKVDSALLEDGAIYAKPDLLKMFKRIASSYHAKYGDELKIVGLTHQRGGAVRDCYDHHLGYSVDVTSDLLDFRKSTYDKEAAYSLLRKSLQEGVYSIFFADSELLARLKNEFSDKNIVISDLHKNKIHMGLDYKKLKSK